MMEKHKDLLILGVFLLLVFSSLIFLRGESITGSTVFDGKIESTTIFAFIFFLTLLIIFIILQVLKFGFKDKNFLADKKTK